MKNSILREIMDKRSFKKHSLKEQDLFRERFNILDEKYAKIKDILKQVLAELRELKAEKQRLTVEQEKLVAEIKEKDELLERMQSVSEAVIDEYTALKVKCDLETEAANNAIKRATKYFQENQKLKRNTGHESELDIAGEDANEILSQESLDVNVSELDVLNNLASELRTEIASLKTQLGKEIEKQNSLKEDFEIAKNLYEQEMKDHNCTKEKLQSLQLIQSISDSSVVDVDSENYPFPSFHCSQVDGTNTTKSNSEKDDHIENYDDLTAKLESTEAEAANYKEENGKLLFKIQELESQIKKLNKEVSASDLLPIPPPPPPPPLPPPSFNPIKSLITFIHAGKKSSKTVKKENSENPQQKAMSEMIDAIKKGNIQLKPTPKTLLPSPKKEVEGTALGEMKNILASLKKKNSPSEDTKSAELQNIQERNSIYFSSQETDENFNIGSDIDDELKSLLRKQSIKITTNEVSDDELNFDSFPTDDRFKNAGKEIGEHLEMPLHEAATSSENKFNSNGFTDHSRLFSENENTLEMSMQKLVTSNESKFADSLFSDESEKSLKIPAPELTALFENQCADNFLSNNNRISIGKETSLEIPLQQPTTESQLSDHVFTDNIKKNAENEKDLKISLLELATKNQPCEGVFIVNSTMSTENEMNIEISLSESTIENQFAGHVYLDKKKTTEENEKSLGISLEKSATENQPPNSVFFENSSKSVENENSLEMPLQKLVIESQPGENVLSVKSGMSIKNETCIKILLQESTTENQLADHVFSDLRKSTENETSLENPLEESVAENQPENVYSDNHRKSVESMKRLEISLQDSTTSIEKQFTDCFISDNSRSSSENETVII